MSEPFTSGDLAAARAQFAGALAECPHCGGFSKHDPRYAPTRCDPMIVLDEGLTLWQVRCFSCSATVTSELDSPADAVEQWNRRVGVAARKPELLPLVDLQALARRCDASLTPEVALFARQVQTDVLRLNRRPL